MLHFPSVTIPSISREGGLLLLLASIAREEMALSHVVNAEAEKVHAVLKRFQGTSAPDLTFADLMQLQDSACGVVDAVTLHELLLQFKLTRAKEWLMRGTGGEASRGERERST